jgi:hypothetical protein
MLLLYVQSSTNDTAGVDNLTCRSTDVFSAPASGTYDECNFSCAKEKTPKPMTVIAWNFLWLAVADI